MSSGFQQKLSSKNYLNKEYPILKCIKEDLNKQKQTSHTFGWNIEYCKDVDIAPNNLKCYIITIKFQETF